MAHSPAASGRTTLVLGLCLFLSGAAGLIYEVLWLRQLSLVMGHTVYALSTVLTAFLGGLALGALMGGRWTRRRGASARLYAAIELAIGVAALAMPWLIAALDPIFREAYRGLSDHFFTYTLLQFAACSVLLLIPTVLMGATLPVIIALILHGQRDIAAGSGRLYAVNSLGAVAGTAMAGFLLLPSVGMMFTGLVAASFNLAAALVALTLRASAPPARRPGPAAAPVAPALEGWPSPPLGMLAILYGVSGFAALTLEVGWTRLVGLSIGSTTYAFTITLVTYIAGLALGSLLLPLLASVRRNPVRAIFACHVVIALWSLASLPYLGSLPLRVNGLIGTSGLGTRGLLAAQALLVFSTIAVPTVAMGGLFPLVTQLIHRQVAASGYAAGTSYAANTLGNILGSWVAGFMLVPLIGMRGVIVFSALLSALVGVLYLLPSLRLRPVPTLLRAGVLASASAAVLWVTPDWNRISLTSALYLPGVGGRSAASGAPPGSFGMGTGTLVDYREGATGVVSVRRLGPSLLLIQDGLSEGGGFNPWHRFLAHLPLVLHGHAQQALVVGLGSGTTLGAVLKHPVDHVDCVEISPEVRDVAHAHFAQATGHPLDDPRVRLIIGDGRNHLRHTERLYDVIISQPSHPWQSGAANLFTREYFADVRAHLAPHGVACSWFFTYADAASRSIIRAWLDVFPHAYLFENAGTQSVLIGLRDDSDLSAANIAHALARPDVARAAATVGFNSPADVFRGFVAGPETLRRQTAGVVANTDDNAFVAFHALPGGAPPQYQRVVPQPDDPTPFVRVTLGSPEETAEFSTRLRAIAERQAVPAPQS